MIWLVETVDEYNEFRRLITTEDCIMIPVYSDIYMHSARNRVCLLYFYFMGSKTDCVIPFTHSETINCTKPLNEVLQTSQRIFVYGKKQFLYFYKAENLYDVDLVHYFHSNNVYDLDDIENTVYDFYTKVYYNESNVNDLIPIVKHYEWCIAVKNKFKEVLLGYNPPESYQLYNKLFIDNLYEIEKTGLFVDYNLFLTVFGRNGLDKNLTYSEYNIYTTTGRPSNRHSGINYGALNKDDDTRKVFISRFEKNGFLIQYDYDAYHLRLIADLIGYSFPENENIHTYLGRQYFNKDVLNQDEYEQSKQISFRQLYGGVQSEYVHIPYFQKVSTFIENLWFTFKEDGFIETPLFKRKLRSSFFDDINKNKLFNYVLQNLETERNMLILVKINEELSKYESKIVLYTYDSFLFDYSIKDGKQLIIKLKEILEDNKKYPVKIQIGADYKNMKDVKLT